MPKPGEINFTTLSYVALRDLKVNGVVRAAGSPIPEAATFRNLHNYISSGQIAIVNGGDHPGAASPTTGKTSQRGKSEGNAEYTRYRPTDHNSVPAKIANDAS